MKKFSLLLTMLCVLSISGFAQQKTFHSVFGTLSEEEIFGQAPVSEPLESSFTMKGIIPTRGNDKSSVWAHAMYVPAAGSISQEGKYYEISVSGEEFTATALRNYRGYYFSSAEYIANADGTHNVYAFANNLTMGYSSINEAGVPNWIAPVDVAMNDMTYDYVHKLLFGVKNGAMYVVEPSNGTNIPVEIAWDNDENHDDVMFMAIAADLKGNIYAVTAASFASVLYRFQVGEDGLLHRVGETNTGYSCRYMQTMAFDHNTGVLYWWQCGVEYATKNILMITFNEAGEPNDIVRVGTSGTQIGGLVFDFAYTPYPIIYDDAVEFSHATMDVNPTQAFPGDNVTLIPTPKSSCDEIASVYYTIGDDDTPYTLNPTDGSYSFIMPNDVVNVFATTTTAEYPITFLADTNGDGTPETISSGLQECGQLIEQPTEAEVARLGYDFDRWDPAIASGAVVTGDATYTAVYTAKQYEGYINYMDGLDATLLTNLHDASGAPINNPLQIILTYDEAAAPGKTYPSPLASCYDTPADFVITQDYLITHANENNELGDIDVEYYKTMYDVDVVVEPADPQHFTFDYKEYVECGEPVTIEYSLQDGMFAAIHNITVENTDTGEAITTGITINNGTVSFTPNCNTTVTFTEDEISLEGIVNICEGSTIELPVSHGLADGFMYQVREDKENGWVRDFTATELEEEVFEGGTYYYRAYETNNYGTFYTDEQYFEVIGGSSISLATSQNQVCFDDGGNGAPIILIATDENGDELDGTYEWFKGSTQLSNGGRIVLAGNTCTINEPSMSDAGQYKVIYHTSGTPSCSAEKSIVVSVMPKPNVPTVDITAESKCHYGNLTTVKWHHGPLDPDDFKFMWLCKNESGVFDTIINNDVYTVADDELTIAGLEETTTYKLVISYNNDFVGCEVESEPFEVEIYPDYPFDIQGKEAVCNGYPEGTLSVEEEGHEGYPGFTTYQWYEIKDDNNTMIQEGASNILDLGALAESGTLDFTQDEIIIEVHAFNGDGCEYISNTHTIEIHPMPSFTVENDYGAVGVPSGTGVVEYEIQAAVGEPVTLTVVPTTEGSDYSYYWYTDTENPWSVEATVIVEEAGVYHLVVTDEETGCFLDNTVVKVSYEDCWTDTPNYDTRWFNTCLNNGVFEVYTNDQLAAFAYEVNKAPEENRFLELEEQLANVVVYINNDLDMTGHLWPVFDLNGIFTGTIEGNGHAVSNLRMILKGNQTGYNAAHVRNLGFRDLSIVNGKLIVRNSSLIENGYITADPSVEDILEHLEIVVNSSNCDMHNFYVNKTNADFLYIKTGEFLPIAQYIEVEAEGGNTALPFDPATQSMSQQIYTPDMLGNRTLIDGMTFYFNGQSFSANVRVYLQPIEAEHFVELDEVYQTFAIENDTLAYNGTLIVAGNGDSTLIEFTTPFEYDGTSNLLLTVVASNSNFEGETAGFKAFQIDGSENVESITLALGSAFDDTQNYEGTPSFDNNSIQLNTKAYRFLPIDPDEEIGLNDEEMLARLNDWVDAQNNLLYYDWMADEVNVNYGHPVMHAPYVTKHQFVVKRMVEKLDSNPIEYEEYDTFYTGYYPYGESYDIDLVNGTIDGEPYESAEIEGFSFADGQELHFVGSMGNEDIEKTVYYKRNSYDLTVKYEDGDDNRYPAPGAQYTENLKFGATYIIQELDVAGYTLADGQTLMGTMPAANTTVIVKYNPNECTLTINEITYDCIGSYTDPITKTIKYKRSYDHDWVDVEGYNLNPTPTETGYVTITMDEPHEKTVTFTKTIKRYTVTAQYLDENEEPIAISEVLATVCYGTTYTAQPKDIEGYITPEPQTLENVTSNQIVKFIYIKDVSGDYWTDLDIRDTEWYNPEEYAETAEYTLHTAAELGGLSAIVNGLDGIASKNFAGKTIYVVLNEGEEAIDFSAHLWNPIGGVLDSDNSFNGTFNANGVQMTGLRVKSDVEGRSSRGFFGIVGAPATVDGVNVSGSVEGYYYAAGVVGKNKGLIVNSTSSVNVISKFQAAGIAGQNSGRIINCYNTGRIQSTAGENRDNYYVGGIVGENIGNGVITNCHNVGEFVNNGSSTTYYGAIAGFSNIAANVSYCYGLENAVATACVSVDGTGELNLIPDNCYMFNSSNAGNVKNDLNSWINGNDEYYSWTMGTNYPVFDMEDREIMDVTEEGMEIAVYPNPTRDVVNVVANGLKRVTVYNMFGQMVIDQEVEGEKYTVDMKGFATGTYMVRVYTEDGVSSRNFVKVR